MKMDLGYVSLETKTNSFAVGTNGGDATIKGVCRQGSGLTATCELVRLEGAVSASGYDSSKTSCLLPQTEIQNLPHC